MAPRPSLVMMIITFFENRAQRRWERDDPQRDCVDPTQGLKRLIDPAKTNRIKQRWQTDKARENFPINRAPG